MPDVVPLGSYDPRSAGPYRLTGRLGTGGQGVVYLGLDDQENRVAVKMINVDLRHNPKAKSQFVKEIAAARRVASFCTAQILFADLDAEPPYVVSEYIEGPTLQRRVRDSGPVSGNALHRLAVGTAAALAAIHLSDVVHCDLKPDNVILGTDGPRVIDFGIARALDATETQTSRIIGTAPYMAPERFHDGDIGPPADVFAWAATIAFAATGGPPFGTSPVMAVMNRVLHEPPDLAGLSGPLAELVHRCLAKVPEERPTAQEVLMLLLGYPGADLASSPPIGTMFSAAEEAVTMVTPPAPTLVTDLLPPGTTTPPPAGTTPSPAGAAGPPGTTTPPPASTTAPLVGQETWRRRFARQAGDAWGISAAIFLGSVGAAVGYVATTAVGTATLVGAVAFTVVYSVRLLVATALPGGTDAAAGGPDADTGHNGTTDEGRAPLRS